MDQVSYGPGSTLDSVSALSTQLATKRAAERAANIQVQLEQLSAQGNVEAHTDAFVELLSMMQGQFMPEREAAVEVLSEVVTTAFGDDGGRIGRLCREAGVIDDLCSLLNHGPSRGEHARPRTSPYLLRLLTDPILRTHFLVLYRSVAVRARQSCLRFS
jgi:hypothetical protein